MTFSITIPTYKSKFIKECIDSILNQTFTDFEIIILNDNSPERIDEIVSEYSDKRIKYFKNEVNCGALNLVDNWNKCLTLAEGDFVICMGDDDRLLPNCLEVYNNLIERYPEIDTFHGWTEIIDEKSNFVRFQEVRPEFESVYSMMWHRWEGRYQYIGDFLFKREKLLEKGGFVKLPLAWASDDLTAYTMATEKGIVNTQVPVFQYRVNSQTISNTAGLSDKMDALAMELAWYNEFLKDKPHNEIDIKFWITLKQRFPIYCIKKRIFRIKVDISNSPFKRLIFWIFNKKRYSVSYTMILKGLLDALPDILRSTKGNRM